VRLGELIQFIGAKGPDNAEKLREFTHCKKRFSRSQDLLFMSNDFIGEFCQAVDLSFELGDFSVCSALDL